MCRPWASDPPDGNRVEPASDLQVGRTQPRAVRGQAARLLGLAFPTCLTPLPAMA